MTLPIAFALLTLVAALSILTALSVVDLRIRILPNKLVALFAVLGFAFHMATLFMLLTPSQILGGAFLGGSILWGIRFIAMRFYGPGALGLGDVKLLAAAGLWLGPVYISTALVAGALAGIAHGLGVAAAQKIKTGEAPKLATLSIPAGPGFAIGIIIAAGLMFYDHRETVVYLLTGQP